MSGRFTNGFSYYSDLSFKRGDVILLRRKVEHNWYQGECNGVLGVFPLSYVQVRYYDFSLTLLYFCESLLSKVTGCSIDTRAGCSSTS